MIEISYKLTIWESFSIEDEHEEGLREFLKNNPNADGLQVHDWAWENGCDPYVERIEGTDELLDLKENGGQSTLEITNDNEIIFQNGK